MPIITLLSDFGDSDHYVAALKARLMKDAPQARLVDISHRIRSSDIAQAGFVLRSVYADFPKGTVHLVAVGAASLPSLCLLAASMDGHYFVVPDNGILPLVAGSLPMQAVALPSHTGGMTFPSKYIMAPAAVELANGIPLHELGDPLESIERRYFSQLRKGKDELGGQVLHVDGYGNLITNIDFQSFEQSGEGRSFTIKFGYERFHSIQQNYCDKEFGDCVILFNSSGLLEIAINQGNAHQLLGLSAGSPVMVSFE